MIIAIVRYENEVNNWIKCNSKYLNIVQFAMNFSEHFGVCTFKNIHKKDQNRTFFDFMKKVDEFEVCRNNFVLPTYRGGQVFHVYSLNNVTRSAIMNVGSFDRWYIYDFPEDLCFFHNHKVWFRCYSGERMIYIKVFNIKILDLLNELDIEYMYITKSDDSKLI